MSVNYGKKLFGKRVRTIERTYDKFFVGKGKGEKNALFSAQAKGCDCAGGVLKRGVGVKPFLINGEVPKIADSSARLFLATEEVDGERVERFGYIAKNGFAYVFDDATGVFENIGVLSNGVGVGATDKDGAHVPIFVCDYGIYRLNQGTLSYVSDIPCQAVACFCGGRVFAVSENFSLIYSAPYEPKDFSESVDGGGRIFLRDDCGKIVGLVPMKNKLCVLFEHGITLLDVSGGARSFVRKDVVYGGDKILLGTACAGNVGGEKVFFLTHSGVSCFDGVKVERMGENLSMDIAENSICSCAFAFGKYFASYTDKENVKRTAIIDAESGMGYEQIAFSGLFSNNATVIGVYETTVYQLACDGVLPTGQEGVFVAETDFDVRGIKTIRKLRFMGEGAFDITICNGRNTLKKSVELVNGSAEIRVDLRGERFSLSIQPSANCEIRKLCATIQTLSGVN